MNLGFSILVGAAIIAAAVAFSGRYAIAPTTGDPARGYSYVWRLDRWTGKMWLCANYFASGGGTECNYWKRTDPD